MSDTRTELEALARERVQRSGVRDLSFRQLADELGVKSSSVHYHFREKNDLTAALIARYDQAFREQLQSLSASGSGLRRKLTGFIDLFEAAASDDKLCLCGMLAAELSALDETSRALLLGFFRHAEKWLTTLFKQHKGQWASPLPPARLAAVVMSGLEGALLLDRVNGPGTHLRAQRQLIASLLVHGKR